MVIITPPPVDRVRSPNGQSRTSGATDPVAHAAAVQARMAISRHEAATHVASFAHTTPWKKPAAIGAAALVAGAAMIWYLEQAGSEVAATKALESPEVRVVSTRFAQRASITLLDGSRVLLAADTRLVVPPGFAEKFRVLKLEGAAGFRIADDPDHPFEVRTARATVRAVGTTFAISSFLDEPLFVKVDKGVVDVIVGEVIRRVTGPSTIAVGPDDAFWEPDSALIDETFGWADGRMVVAGRRLGETLPLVRRWYGLEIMVADSALYQRTVHVQAPLSSLKEVIAGMEASGRMQLAWTRNNTMMILYDSGAAPRAKTRRLR